MPSVATSVLATSVLLTQECLGFRAGPVAFPARSHASAVCMNVAEAEAPARTVVSWYDSGVRLAGAPAEVQEEAVVAEMDEVVEEVVAPPPPPPPPAPPPPPPPPITASAEASLAAGLISALAVLGVDIASAGIVENFDIAVLVGGLALSQVDSAGPVGTTLRTVGNVTSAVVNKGVIPAATAVSTFWSQNEVGVKSRAVLELGIESALYAFDPERRERERAEAAAAAAAAKAAAEAEARRAEKEALPWWDPSKYAP